MSQTTESPGDGGSQAPTTSKDKEAFSSGGKRQLLLLRGPTGLKIDKALLWATGYSLVTKQYCVALGVPYSPTLMITTIGARTKLLRTACLPFFKVGEDLVLRGSNGGGPTDPHWVHNARAHPQAWVRLHRKTKPMHVHVAQGEEREQLYETLCRMSFTTERYQQMCKPRELPLVVLRDWSRVAGS